MRQVIPIKVIVNYSAVNGYEQNCTILNPLKSNSVRVSFEELKRELERVLLQLSFPASKAQLCASIFAGNSRDGVYSHGLSRFPVFVNLVKEGLIDPLAEPARTFSQSAFEQWDGRRGAGMYNATVCMDRAVALSREHGIGCVALGNSNHWMRGGTYGIQAAEAGCISICFTNASAGLPPWGGTVARLGNNPLVIAAPWQPSPLLLDMAMSQYSYGKLQEYQFRNEKLPLPGGYDENGQLTNNPESIIKTKRALPIGYWKGSGLALMLDIVLTGLTGGTSTAAMARIGREVGLSQCFISIYRPDLHQVLIREILEFTKDGNEGVSYPGENTWKRRLENEQKGIPVNEPIWNAVLKM